MDEQILQHTSLKVLYFYRPDVTAVRMPSSNSVSSCFNYILADHIANHEVGYPRFFDIQCLDLKVDLNTAVLGLSWRAHSQTMHTPMSRMR